MNNTRFSKLELTAAYCAWRYELSVYSPRFVYDYARFDARKDFSVFIDLGYTIDKEMMEVLEEEYVSLYSIKWDLSTQNQDPELLAKIKAIVKENVIIDENGNIKLLTSKCYVDDDTLIQIYHQL